MQIRIVSASVPAFTSVFFGRFCIVLFQKEGFETIQNRFLRIVSRETLTNLPKQASSVCYQADLNYA